MKTTTITEAAYRAACEKIQDHTIRLTRLENIIKVCAFACESRRILEGIEDALSLYPDVESKLSQHVDARSNWTEMQDCTGDTLSALVYQIGEINEGLQRIPFELKN